MQITVPKTTAIQTSVITQSFMWMFVGLIITGISSMYISSNESLLRLIFANTLIYYGLIFAELGLVFFLSLRITKMSFETALISFLAYSLLNGITLSAIFIVYTSTSVGATFLTTSLVFGTMAFYGYTTKRDLTTIGNLAFMALIGVILASIVNIFLRSNAFSYVLSYLSIFIFVGLTAYDTQKIKNISAQTQNNNIGILGALTLYLDFINIFLNLLRVMGRRRSD